MPMELVFVIGMAVLLILCIKVKANAFISLLATALVMGMLSGMSGADTVSAITSGFSGTVKSIGIVIIFGIMLGNYLDAAKGTNRMAYDAVKLVGQKRAGLAMAITGYIVSIPVFSDAAFVILTPLVKAIHKKTKIPLAILAVSLSAGLLSTHVFVPPTPGPLAAAGLLGIDIGRAILYAAFRQQYDINLRQTPNDSLHWWEFLAMFESLDENTRMAKVMYWRTCDTKGMGKEQKAFIKQMRNLYSLEEPQTTMDSRMRLAKRNAEMRAYVKKRMEECRNG